MSKDGSWFDKLTTNVYQGPLAYHVRCQPSITSPLAESTRTPVLMTHSSPLVDLVLCAFELQDDPTHLIPHVGAPDVGHDLEAVAELIDDRLGDELEWGR